MNDRNRTPRRGSDGVRVQAAPRGGLLAPLAIAAAVVVVIGAIALLLLGGGPPTDDLTPALPSGVASRPPRDPGARVAGAVRPVVGVRSPRRADDARGAGSTHPAPVGANDAGAESAPEAAVPPADGDDSALADWVRDVVEGLRGGEREGIGVYPPRGTNPPKPGLVVPDDFDLPEGYVRYHQVTDDGRRLDPILMFSPDHEHLDADGAPIELPADGIVPPEMAPEGLPVRILAIPADASAGDR